MGMIEGTGSAVSAMPSRSRAPVSAFHPAQAVAGRAKARTIGAGLCAACAAAPEQACSADPLPRAESAAELSYIGEVWRNSRGGVRSGTRYLDKISLVLEGRVGGPRGVAPLDYRLQVRHSNDASLSDELIGDLQVVSNIDAPGAVRIDEAWVAGAFGADGQHAWLTGLYDLNSEFDVLESAAVFLNSSHGIGLDFAQSGLNGPSIFPVSGLAARFETRVGDGVKARFAVLDAVPGRPGDINSHSLHLGTEEGVLLVAELDARSAAERRVMLGGWAYNRQAPTLLEADDDSDRAAGAYAALESSLGPSARVFLRAGLATESVHVVGRYLGAGVTRSASLGITDAVFGFAIAHARTGSDYRRRQRANGFPVADAETTLEFMARFAFPGGWVVQPNVQYVVHPGANPAVGNALVLGLRFEASWGLW